MYLIDSYQTEFDSTVEEIKSDEQGMWVRLEKTLFYPTSGGQPSDRGTLTHEGIIYTVRDCRKSDGKIFHLLDHPGLSLGSTVHGTIDWARRYRLMRSHTAAHIISSVAHQEYHAQISGNQLDVDKCRVDFSLEQFDRTLLLGLQQKTNSVIARDLIVSATIMAREEAFKIPALVKLEKGLDPTIMEVRVLSIGDFDTQADAGTHVHHTLEIKGIEIFDLENKGKGRKRLYFKLVD